MTASRGSSHPRRGNCISQVSCFCRWIRYNERHLGGLPWRFSQKRQPVMQETQVLLPESGRLLEEGNGKPLQYCCLGNPKDRVAWQAIWSMETQRVGHDLATKPLNLLPGKSKNNNNTFNSEIYFQLHKVHFYCK